MAKKFFFVITKAQRRILLNAISAGTIEADDNATTTKRGTIGARAHKTGAQLVRAWHILQAMQFAKLKDFEVYP